MRALSTLLLGAALSIVIQACVVVAQSTIPSFPPAPLPSGEPTQPANPAANGFYQPSPAAVSKLGKYTTFIELWFAGNSFDYLFGAFPGARGINEYNADVASGQYTQQRYPSNAPPPSRSTRSTLSCPTTSRAARTRASTGPARPTTRTSRCGSRART